MTDDKVKIDPEFRRSGHRGGEVGRGPRWIALAVIAVAVSGLSWVLRSPEGSPPEGTLSARAPNLGGPTTAASPALVDRVPAGVPLGEAVPGFVDTITALTRGTGGVGVLRWLPSESAPATMLALGDAGGGRNRSVDASGRWFLEIRGTSTLDIFILNDGNARSHEPRRPSGAAAGAETWSAAWHDTRPGRLAWLVCPRDAPPSSTELRTADLGDLRAEPSALTLTDLRCEDRGVWLVRWGEWGLLLHATEPSGIVQVLLDSEGRQLAKTRPGPDGEWFVGVGPENTTVWTQGRRRSGSSSFLLTGGEPARRPVPGLAHGERLEGALASPDGSLLALVPDLAVGAGSAVRVVEVDTGNVVADIEESTSRVNRVVWSTDSRFLVYERRPGVATNRPGAPQHVQLVVYDTETAAAVALPLSGYAAALRSAR